MAYTLSLNTNPFVNRYAEPRDLIEAIAYDIKIRDIQLTHEFINPAWPAYLIKRLVKDMNASLRRTGARVTSGMTGPYGRLNHFGHPDPEVRSYYLAWFKTFCDIVVDLGGHSLGTQFAIFTYRDFDDPSRREDLINRALDCWAELAQHAKAAGLEFLFWEPMSIGREFGETIQSAHALQDRIFDRQMDIPLLMMADIDHGDVTSTNPDDYDPYAWARSVPRVSPIIHIKQSLMDKGGHRPFTAEFNRKGKIEPQKLIDAFNQGGGADNEICLELSFKEREPNDRQVVSHIAESVAHWAPWIDTGARDLNIASSD